MIKQNDSDLIQDYLNKQAKRQARRRMVDCGGEKWSRFRYSLKLSQQDLLNGLIMKDEEE